ncbi:deoxyribose-phosphate aldolase [Microbacterium sorbitolivorans]|uniref:Deoxyribose-phosphate aldolase n=1 Tax=Microbacterium sorbitolivorans TaxID=1867410 RepID=A0A367Y2S6_9MICO|nr:deoxyribose-phosphate aldolase [Microbacterium sorbitolivorans]RCK59929.1 deoxyribose-phosphate aldolase [Microbacterium sorbitolivorans]GGF41199.1 deoxyribose-phosphate aldolase [Microbacterium sorbitolivorans]
MTPAELAKTVDHTLLKPEATRADVEATIAEAAELGTYSVCLSPNMLPVTVPEGLKAAVVCGFPSGKHASEIKAAEARLSAAQGADEVDMVIDVGAAIEGRYADVEADIRAVREAAPGVVLKVIIESAALNDEQIVAVCEASRSAGADFVKTSTGFHPAGGASVHAVELMARTVGGELGVKASGGIRSWDDATAMIAAGATRLGLSSTRAVLAGEKASGTY